MILVIGNLGRWERSGRGLPTIEGFRFGTFADVNSGLVEDLCPTIILSPLVDDTFDAIDLARVLGVMGYGGQYRAITESLPDLDAVRAEVRKAAPDLDFDLFVLSAPPP